MHYLHDMAQCKVDKKIKEQHIGHAPTCPLNTENKKRRAAEEAEAAKRKSSRFFTPKIHHHQPIFANQLVRTVASHQY
jgi:hypothetical protein